VLESYAFPEESSREQFESDVESLNPNVDDESKQMLVDYFKDLRKGGIVSEVHKDAFQLLGRVPTPFSQFLEQNKDIFYHDRRIYFTDKELDHLILNYEIFVDKNGEGQINKADFQRCFGHGNYHPSFSDRIFDIFDSDKDGDIDFMEYASGLSILMKGTAEEKSEFGFKLFDSENSGYVGLKEFKRVFTHIFLTLAGLQVVVITNSSQCLELSDRSTYSNREQCATRKNIMEQGLAGIQQIGKVAVVPPKMVISGGISIIRMTSSKIGELGDLLSSQSSSQLHSDCNFVRQVPPFQLNENIEEEKAEETGRLSDQKIMKLAVSLFKEMDTDEDGIVSLQDWKRVVRTRVEEIQSLGTYSSPHPLPINSLIGRSCTVPFTDENWDFVLHMLVGIYRSAMEANEGEEGRKRSLSNIIGICRTPKHDSERRTSQIKKMMEEREKIKKKEEKDKEKWKDIQKKGSENSLSFEWTFSDSDSDSEEEEMTIPEEFGEVQKLSFSCMNCVGNEKEPDWNFKAIAPKIFSRLRSLFNVDQSEYLYWLGPHRVYGNLLLGNISTIIEVSNTGRSGSFLYKTVNEKYIIKTLPQEEKLLLKHNLLSYCRHMTDNPNSLLTKFLGLYVMDKPDRKKVNFVVMLNVFNTNVKIHETYDLKGSTVNRSVKMRKGVDMCGIARKDNDFNRTINLPPLIRSTIFTQIKIDSKWMAKHYICDYSLLVGIHYPPKKKQPKTWKDSVKSFSTVDDGFENDQCSSSEVEITHSQYLINSHSHSHSHLLDYSGGFPSSDSSEVYFLGIIDVLTEYNFNKKAEHTLKSIFHDPTQISAIPPNPYRKRFVSYMDSIIK